MARKYTVPSEHMVKFLAFCKENELDRKDPAAASAFRDTVLNPSTGGGGTRESKRVDVWVEGVDAEGSRLLMKTVGIDRALRNQEVDALRTEIEMDGGEFLASVISEPY